MSERLRIFTEHLPAGRPAAAAVLAEAPAFRLVLPFEQRQKARQRTRVAAGFEIGIHVPRGTVLRGGDRLRAADGTLLEIVAAREAVSTVYCRDLRRLAQAAYHLGNRHVALEVGTGWVRYLADHVLDDLVLQLGLAVAHGDEPFEPEGGAYGGADAATGPRHDHSHGHSHGLGHGHGAHEHRAVFGGAHRHPHGHER